MMEFSCRCKSKMPHIVICIIILMYETQVSEILHWVLNKIFFTFGDEETLHVYTYFYNQKCKYNY